ncbi:hypothetical protein Tco_0226274 [Tanacetum coccineum]
MFNIISIGYKFVAPEDIVIGLLTIDDGSAGQVLQKCGRDDHPNDDENNAVVNLKQLEEQRTKADEREQAAKERQKAVEDWEMAAEERNELPRSENKLSRNGKG